MIPQPYHEQAYRLFCTLARRMHEHEGSTRSAGYQPTLQRKVLLTTLNSPLDQHVMLCSGVSHPGHSEVRTPAHASRPGFKLRNGFEGLTSQYGARIEQVQLDDIALARYSARLQGGATAPERGRKDEELAAQEVGGADLVGFSGWFFRKLALVPSIEGKVLTALDTGGFAALVELLRVYHLDSEDGYYQIENMSETESER
jgi:hypothetical protein